MSASPIPTRVLIVDDDATLRTMVVGALETDGISVMEADSGERGLELAAAQPPDLVLLDVVLPGIDGYAVCRSLHGRPGGDLLPVIMLTGLDDSQSVQAAFDAGATDFITKPINWTLFRFRIRYALRATAAMRGLAHSEATLANAQRLASLGSWEWLPDSDGFVRSDPYYALFVAVPADFGTGLAALLQRVHPADRADVEAAYSRARAGGRFDLTYRIAGSDGTTRTVREVAECRVRGAPGSGGTSRVLGTVQDITRQVESERRIRQLAYFDAVTRLPNRVLFAERLEVALARAAQAGGSCSVVVLDLDRFRSVNETFGPEFGDRVLRAVGRRLRDGLIADAALARSGAAGVNRPLLARLAGDTFAAMVAGDAPPDGVRRLANRMLEHIRQPVSVDGKELALDAHAGIAFAPAHATRADPLLKAAETALNRVRRNTGAGSIAVYSGEMETAARLRFVLEGDLRRAIDHGDLELHYQPIVEVASRRIVRAEALVRWAHPTLGPISPAEFIPLAEESRLIHALTRQVVEKVAADLREFEARLPPGFRACINLSALNVQDPRFTAAVTELLVTAGVDTARVEFELTESALMRDVEEAAKCLAALRSAGFRLAIDDFGTGYSSLSYLRRFPVDTLKIDRSFVQEIGHQRGSGIADAIIGVARSLELEVVAEGVETAAQMSALERRGCTLMQGYLFSRPLPIRALGELLGEGVAYAGSAVPARGSR